MRRAPVSRRFADGSSFIIHHSSFITRSAFTLVELLVAMALIVFVMVILSEAFEVGLESFRRLKAIGDMNSRMRTTVIALQSDLEADHFPGRKRVSDPNFWADGPPPQGFFRIWHGSPTTATGPFNFIEDRDTGGDQIPSTRAVNHILHMTVKKRGNNRKDFFLASVPAASPLLNLGFRDARYQDTPNIFTSQWAEVAYFLRSNGNFAGATPLYALYRRQRVLVPAEVGTAVAAAEYPNYLDVSCRAQGGNLFFNGPMDVAMPVRRFGMDPTQGVAGLPSVRPVATNPGTWSYPTMGEENPALEGGDLLLPDVISFEVTVLLEDGTEFVDLFDSTVTRFQSGNPRFIGANGPRVYDTWTHHVDNNYDYTTWDLRTRAAQVNPPRPATQATESSIPLYQWQPPTPPPTPLDPNPVTPVPVELRIVAVKITLRVWDVKTQQARQVSLVQDL